MISWIHTDDLEIDEDIPINESKKEGQLPMKECKKSLNEGRNQAKTSLIEGFFHLQSETSVQTFDYQAI